MHQIIRNQVADQNIIDVVNYVQGMNMKCHCILDVDLLKDDDTIDEKDNDDNHQPVPYPMLDNAQ